MADEIKIEVTQPTQEVEITVDGRGEQGPAGPNEVTASTTTTLTGWLYADGSNITTGSPAGSGDMEKSTYDPTNIAGDAFARANHTGTQTLATISDAGTAAAADTGTGAGNVVVLDGAAKLPAVDGSQLTNLPGGTGGDAWSDPVDADIVPDGDSTRDLGTTLVRFADAFIDSLTITTNIVVGGTVDGRDIATDGTKLDGIEAGATADQTGAEIKVAYEAEADTNAYTDAEKTKLAGIETGADVTDTTNVTAAGALMDSEVDADIKTLALPANTTISTFGASLIDDLDAGAARTTLGVDAAGTDNSTDVTLAGTPDYITISGQVITRNAIDLTADVTGDLPFANIAAASAADKLLGRGSAGGAGDFQEITLGTGLSMSGTTLSSTGGSGDVASDTIWDAAGDLAVGTGADTAARLAIGTAGQVLKVNGTATGLEWGTGGSGGANAILALVLDGADAAITVDMRSNMLRVPWAGTLKSYYIFSQTNSDRDSGLTSGGSNTITLYKVAYTNPWATPTTVKAMTINSANKNSETSLSLSVAAGDILFAQPTTLYGDLVLLDITLEIEPT